MLALPASSPWQLQPVASARADGRWLSGSHLDLEVQQLVERRSGLPVPGKAAAATAALAAAASSCAVVARARAQRRRQAHRARVLHLAVAQSEVSSATCEANISAFADEWQPEAERCWAPRAKGVVPGFIANMMEKGVEYDVSLRSYVRREVPEEKPAADRLWRRLEGERVKPKAPVLHTQQDNFIYYYSGKQARDNQSDRDKDYNLVKQFFMDGVMEDSGAERVALDVGCGDAFMARRLAQSGKFSRVYAVDTSWRQLDSARQAAEEERTGPEDGLFLLRADAQALPFRDCQVDCVSWGLGLHTVEDPAVALKSIFSVMRPGGKLFATTIMSGYIPEDIARMAAEAGFEQLGMRVPRSGVYAFQAVRP